MTKMLGFFDFIDLDFLVFTACLKEVYFEILENTLDLLNQFISQAAFFLIALIELLTLEDWLIACTYFGGLLFQKTISELSSSEEEEDPAEIFLKNEPMS